MRRGARWHEGELIMSKEEVEQLIDALDEFKKSNDERIQAVKAGTEAALKEIDEKFRKIEEVIVRLAVLKRDIENSFDALAARVAKLEGK